MRLTRAVLIVAGALLLGWAAPALAQTFVFGAQGEPVQFDPAVITDGISGRITNQVFDTLVRYKGSTTLIEPGLAEKWEVSKDGRVWTLHLRKNVKFHDGNPLDAAAVVWNFERWWKSNHPQHENQLKAGQTFEYWEGQFEGFDEKSIVAKVEAVGSHSVRVTLKAPQAPFLANIGIFSFGVASPKAVEKWGTEFGKHPVGTGAFKFVEWKPNQEVILEANPDYWGVKPKVKRVVVRNIKDNSQRLAALKAGEIHGMEGLNPDDVAVVRKDPTLQLILRPANTTGYVALNYKVKEFQDKRVRQAIAHAINKKAIVDALYGGIGLVATQFQPPPLWGYNKELKGHEYSPAKAQELLKQAGFPQGFSEVTWEDGKKEPLVFWYMSRSRPYFPNPKEIGEAIAADLAKVGIKAQVQTVEWANYLDKRKNGQLPIYMLGWTGDNGDPDNFLCYFFCSPGVSREGFYSNKALADLLLRAQSETKQAERAKLYRQAEQMLHDDVARLFIANAEPPLALLKKVKGYIPNPTSTEYFNTVEIQLARSPRERTGAVRRYAIQRSLTVIPVLLGVSILVFSFIHLIPGDPALTMLGERATPEKVAEVRQRLGLERPIHEQYLLYVGKVLRGDLGISIVRGDPVLTDLLRRFPATVELATAAILVALLFGIPIGIVSAVWRNSLVDSLSRVWALTGVSMPIFWLGVMLAWFFGVQLRWFPTGFRLDTATAFEPWTNFVILDAALQGNWVALRDALRHLILPAVALATIPLAVIARMTRASMLEVLSREYIRTAQAKGLPQAAIILRHALRNALLPVLTVVGLQVGQLLAGAILTETIFSWPGIGLWVYESIESRDYAIVQGASLFIAVIFVSVNLVTDLLYAAVDPRIKYD